MSELGENHFISIQKSHFQNDTLQRAMIIVLHEPDDFEQNSFILPLEVGSNNSVRGFPTNVLNVIAPWQILASPDQPKKSFELCHLEEPACSVRTNTYNLNNVFLSMFCQQVNLSQPTGSETRISFLSKMVCETWAELQRQIKWGAWSPSNGEQC